MSLQSLPPEIIYEIVLYLDPLANVRTLRHLILATPKSSTINKVANDRLQMERDKLLDQFESNHRDTANFGDQEALEEIAKLTFGKQIISKSQTVDGDQWV